LKGLPNVIGIRCLGLAGAVELSPLAGAPGKRAYDIFMACFHQGVLVRPAADNIVICPPYIVEKAHIERIVEVVADAIRKCA
ncbi:MAG: aspartate aminotransferase family protein, partial [Polaromonas sp.]